MKNNFIFIAISLLTFNVIADENVVKPITVGDVFKPYTFENPHEEKHTLKPETKLVIMSFEMEISKGIHTWLEKKEPDFLAKHNAEYVADITEMPGIITYLFARPKMQKYEFPILLADDDDFAPQFPKEEGKFVLFELNQNKEVVKISYFTNMDELSHEYFEKVTEVAPVAQASVPEIKKHSVKSK